MKFRRLLTMTVLIFMVCFMIGCGADDETGSSETAATTESVTETNTMETTSATESTDADPTETTSDSESEEETETEGETSPFVGVWQGTDQNWTTISLRANGVLFYSELGSNDWETVEGTLGSWEYDEASGKITMKLTAPATYTDYVLSGIPEDGAMVLKCENGQVWNDEIVLLTDRSEAWVRTRIDQIHGKEGDNKYTAFAEIVEDYEACYGSAEDWISNGQGEGVCYYELIDFNNDGWEELLLCYCTPDETYGHMVCQYEVWQYYTSVKRAGVEMVGTGIPYAVEGSYYMVLAENNGCRYLVTEEGGSIDSVTCYYGFDSPNTFGLIEYPGGEYNVYQGICVSGPENLDLILEKVNETREKLSLPGLS